MIQIPYIIDLDNDAKPLTHIGERQTLYDEAWLQNIIEKYPDILPTQEFEPIFSPLIAIGTEVRTKNGGFIDNLFISPAGYITLVETKLWRNTEAKREVLSQVIEYASSISKMTFRDLDQIVKSYSRQKTGHEVKLVDWVGGFHTIDAIDFEKNVTKNLQNSRFLALIVGDRIRYEMMDYLDDIIHTTNLRLNIGFVELRCFTINANDDWPLLVVPYIPAKTVDVKHHVTLGEIQSATTFISEPKRTGKPRIHISTIEKQSKEKGFWELLKASDERGSSISQDLISYFKGIRGIYIEMETDSIVARLNPLKMTVFYIIKDGSLATTPKNITNTLKNKGYDSSVVGNYEDFIRDTLGMSGNTVCKTPITDVDIEAFKKEVVALINRIQSSKRK